ncbi:dephospho-CoA kinase [Patescibacteria group bacterium]
MAYSPKVLLGVTGYLGSGKSTALKYFEKHGFLVIDADEVVHELYEPGKDGWRKIKDFFGEEYLVKGKGKVNRPKLRKIVFNNTAKLKILEKLVQPVVFNEIRKRIQKAKPEKVALESTTFDKQRLGMDVSHILWIDSTIKSCFERCSKKRKLTKVEHRNIVDHQKKPKKINFTLRNNKGKKELREKIDKIAKKLI